MDLGDTDGRSMMKHWPAISYIMKKLWIEMQFEERTAETVWRFKEENFSSLRVREEVMGAR